MNALNKMRELLEKVALSRSEMNGLIDKAEKEWIAEVEHWEEKYNDELSRHEKETGIFLSHENLLEQEILEEFQSRYEGYQRGSYNLNEILHDYKAIENGI